MAEYGDEIDELFGDGLTQTATGLGVANIDEDPEAAAMAMRLERYTGVPASVIHGDLDGFQARHKADLTAQMLRNNKHIAKYVAEFPMAAKVSNDDYPELNDLSQSLTFVDKLGMPRLVKNIQQGVLEKFREDFGEGPIRQDRQETIRALEMLGTPQSPEAIAAFERQPVPMMVAAGKNVLQALASLTHGAVKGFATTLHQDLEAQAQVTGWQPDSERKIEREIGGVVEWLMGRGDINLSHPTSHPETRQITKKIEQSAPYVGSGEIPPPGVFPEIDKLKVDQAKADAKTLDDAVKSAGKSKTVERSPDAGEHFIRGQVGDREIGLSGEAALELYGDKLPELDDGILGWVPGIKEQLDVARETGADIKIPLAGWLARPEFAKELTDHVRVRPESMTKFEAENFEPPEPPTMAEGGPDMSRRGFLKGTAATVATAATAKLPKLGEVGAKVTEGLKAESSVWGPGELMRMHTESAIRAAAEDLGKDLTSPEVQEAAIKKLQRQVDYWKDYEKVEQYKDYANMYRESIDLTKSGFAKGLKKFAEEAPEGAEKPPILPDVSTLPEPTDYMKSGYPEGIVEPGVPRESSRSPLLQAGERQDWRSPEGLDRLAILKQLWSEGKPAKAIAEALDVSENTVQQVLKTLRGQGEEIPSHLKPAQVDHRVKQLIAEGKTYTEVAKLLDMTKGQVARRVMVLREKGEMPKVGEKVEPGLADVSREAPELDAELARLLERDPGASIFDTLAQTEEPATVLDTIRREGAFDPPLAAGKPDLKLKHVGTKDADGITFDTFQLRKGRKAVGTIDLHLRPNGLMIVGNIEGYEGGGPNAFGYHTIRALFDQIKAEYPGTKRIGGYRITGARETATKAQGVDRLGWTEVPLKEVEDFHQFLNKITGWDKVEPEPAPPPKPGTFKATYQVHTEVELRSTDAYSAKEKEILAAAREVLGQIAPNASLLTVDKIKVKGSPATGTFYPASWNESGRALVMAAMNEEFPKATMGTVLHEAIHHLRDGFFTPEEWATLEKAAVDEKWIEKARIRERYPTAPDWLIKEEAIAEGYRMWANERFLKGAVAPKEAAAIFKRIKELFDQLRERLYEIFGKKITADELFTRVTAGEIGRRPQTEFGKDRFSTAGPKTMAEDFDKATSLEEQEMFAKGAAIGMTQVQFKKYLKLIEERREADEARAQARADRASQVTKTEQWKENEPRVKQEVTDQINQRPDVLADEFFRRGMLNGEKIKRQYIGAEHVTAEQAAALGSDIVRKDGVNPLDVAGLFGFVSSEHMLDAMTKLNQSRNESGLSPGRFKDRMIKDQTQRVMMKKYGVPDYDALLKEMREDIVTETQMDMLHEETVALATNAGQAPPMGKGDIKSWVGTKFGESRVGTVNDLAMWIREAGKSGRAAELALLKDDALEAFKHKQRQYISTLFAAEAKRLGKEMDRADKTFKNLSTHNTIASVDQPYLDQLHRIMDQIGRGNKRNPRELAGALAGKTLEAFVDEKVGELRELPVADFLMDPGYSKQVKDMSVSEFRAVHDSVKTMLHNARDEQKLQDINGKAELTALTVEARTQAEKISRVYEPRNPGAISRLKSAGYKFDAALLKMEQLMDWLDREDPNGVFNRIVFRRIADSKHVENDLRKELGQKLKEVPTKGIKWDRGIEHEEILDWKNGDPVNLSERDMVGMMLNMGSKSNFEKLTAEFSYEGGKYSLSQDTVMRLVEKNARKEHWDFVQGMWDTFEHLWPRIEKLSRDMSGLAPEKIEPREIKTAFGTYSGGYYPLIADHRWEGTGPSRARGIFGEDKYTRAVPLRGYTKARTGVAYPLELDPNISSQKLMETAHDLAYREALVDAKKFLEHPEVRRSIRNALGPEYLAQVRPWLENVANPAAMRMVSNEALSGINTVARVARERLVAVQLMYRASTIMKHSIAAALDSVGEVGLKEFSGEMAHFYAQPWKTKERVEWVMERSGELRNRLHDMDRDIGEMMDRSLGSNGLYASAMHYGAIGVSTLDIGTALPTWMVAYKRALRDGASEADATFIGDKAVRAAHGSTGVPDLPAIMRGPDVLRLFTVAYGFFNHNYNRIRNIGRLLGKEGVAGDLGKGDISGAWLKFQRAAWMSTWYVVLMAAIEEAVSPLPGGEKESWGSYIGKGIFHQLSGTVPFVRDMAGYWLGRSRPTDPVSQIGEAVFKPLQDLKRYHDGKKTTNVVRHLFESVGYALAIPGMGQAGVTAQYLADIRSGRQRAESWFLGHGMGTNVIPFGGSTTARGLTLGRSDPHKKLR